MHTVSGGNSLEAWRGVVKHLLAANGESFNVVVAIQDPSQEQPDWLRRFNPRALAGAHDHASDVANTIFPLRTWQNSADREEFYSRYARAYDRGRRRRPSSWGTYFRRLTCFGTSKVNQLERAIVAMRGWKTNHRAAVVFHLSSAETDAVRVRGGPCLQYIQLACPTATSMSMVALYRNHDYFNKALGNFVGLARLLAFVASETGRTPARLICHSVRAYFDVSAKTMTALVNR